MIRRPPRSTPFPTRRSSDLCWVAEVGPRTHLLEFQEMSLSPKDCCRAAEVGPRAHLPELDRKSTRLNSSHGYISYAVFCLKKKKTRPQEYYVHSSSDPATST